MAREASFYDGETFNFKVRWHTYTATIERDEDHGAPWDEECGHGEVSDWTRRDKLPGELVLCEDRGSKRYYDFQGACKLALKDGWGFLPSRMICDRFARSGKRKFRAFCVNEPDTMTCYASDRNEAIRALYAKYSATMSKREYAARAAMADYEYLRKWCADQWFYVGVIVHREGGEENTASLWGIENTAGDYIREVARELADELKG